MTPDEYRHVLDRLGLSHQQAADAFGLTKRASQLYAAGQRVPTAVALLLRLMVRMHWSPRHVWKLAGKAINPRGDGGE